MGPGMHTLEPTLDFVEIFPAVSRAAAAYNGAGIDLAAYNHELNFQISAGTFGGSATLDAKIQESDDNSSFADLSPTVTLAQKTAAGFWNLTLSARKAKKRYVRIVVTVGTAAIVFSVVLAAKPLKAE